MGTRAWWDILSRRATYRNVEAMNGDIKVAKKMQIGHNIYIYNTYTNVIICIYNTYVPTP